MKFLLGGLIAIATFAFPVAICAGTPPLDKMELQLLGLAPTYAVDTTTQQKSIFKIAAESAVRARRTNAVRAMRPQMVGAEAPSFAAPAPTALPTLSPPHSAWQAAAEVANLGIAFVRVCRSGWKSPSHTCYADLTMGPKPVAWSAPNATPKQFLGSDDPSATPPPLMSVRNQGPGVAPSQTDAQVALTADVDALQATHPGVARGSALPPNLQLALNEAARQPGVVSGLAIPALDTAPLDARLALDASNYATLRFRTKLAPPGFTTSSSGDVAYGSDFTSAVDFSMNLTLLRQTIVYQKTIANLETSVAIPVAGSAPTLKISSDVMGVSSNQLINYDKSGPEMHFSNARKQVSTEDLCAFSQAFPIVSSVTITLRLSCPATFGYSLIFDAVPQEASARLAPVVAIDVDLDADVRAAGGLISIGSYASANLITAQARVGAYADLVQNPNPSGPTADPRDLYVVTRPYEFATMQSGDGFIYIVVKLGSTTTFVKVAQWQPFLAVDFDDAGKFSAFRLTR